MALGKAVTGGAVAGLGLPTVLLGHQGALGDFIRSVSIAFELAGYRLGWSWAVFAVVTLFAWGFVAWAEK